MFRQEIKLSEIDRSSENKLKNGLYLGVEAINPVNDNKIPIWIADYVLSSYGTGAVMGVPGHDQRDYEFAIKYNLDIKYVIKEFNQVENSVDTSKAYTNEGEIINSVHLPLTACPKTTDYLRQRGSILTKFL